MNWLAVFVEFLGTFIFLSVIVATGNPWAIGATLAVLIFIGGAISGGNFNPAVSIMSWYNRGLAADTTVAYVIAQVIGGILAVSVYNEMKKRSIL